MTTISNLGMVQVLTSGLQSQESTFSALSQELASGQQYSNLTEYDPTDAHNILDFQNAITQRQSYVSSMQTVQDRLSLYDSTMTDMESMASQASDLATQDSSYNPSSATDIQSQVTDYLQQLGDDLNQQIDGRYIYAGSRYTTPPVSNLTTLTSAPTTTTTTSPALPSYDVNYDNATSFTVNSAPTSSANFTVGSGTTQVSIPWSQIENGSITSVYLGGSSTPTTLGSSITLPNAAASTPAEIAANAAMAISGVAADTTDVPSTYGISSLTATASNGTVTMNFNGTTSLPVTPDDGGATGETTWVGGGSPDGTVTQTPNTDAAAYTQDSVLIDSNYSVTYGVSSNNPAFQQLVNGLRYMLSAVSAGQSGNTTTYQSDMQTAATLINNGLSGVQDLHAGVADNESLLTTEASTQTSDITNLQNQLTNIQSVDLAQVGTEINLLQTQMEASYSATASLEKLSLVTYL